MRKISIFFVVAAILGGVAFVNAKYAPSRMTEASAKAKEEAQKSLEETHEKMKKDSEQSEIQLAENTAAEGSMSKLEEVPDVFKVKFECSNGSFVMELHKAWSPLGVQRIYDLVNAKFFDEARFFRVVPGFVVQWGIPADPAVAAKWRENGIKDEPVVQSNTRGMVTFAKSSLPNSRTTQMFINLVDNQRLDGMGFSSVGKIVEGLDVVEKINSEYRESPNQGLIQSQGNAYLKKSFPNLDYIKSASIVTGDTPTESAPATPAAPAAPKGPETPQVVKP